MHIENEAWQGNGLRTNRSPCHRRREAYPVCRDDNLLLCIECVPNAHGVPGMPCAFVSTMISVTIRVGSRASAHGRMNSNPACDAPHTYQLSHAVKSKRGRTRAANDCVHTRIIVSCIRGWMIHVPVVCAPVVVAERVGHVGLAHACTHRVRVCGMQCMVIL
jgi:hypothetical protein